MSTDPLTALICLTAGKSLDALTDADFARDLAASPSAGPHTWTHNSSRAFSLHQACYELRICQQPPRQARPGKASLEQCAQEITQPGIREAALRYLTTVASTLRPGTVDARAASLITFAEYLVARHPEVRGLTQLTREHVKASSPSGGTSRVLTKPSGNAAARHEPTRVHLLQILQLWIASRASTLSIPENPDRRLSPGEVAGGGRL
jgi:hypothetical protein